MTSRTLTPNQTNFIDEVCSSNSTNIMLEALAGCGKTTTIEYAMQAYNKKFPLKKAAAFCFNVNIKNELKARNLKAYNFHGYGLFIITQRHKGFNPKYHIDENRGFRIAAEMINADMTNMDGIQIKAANTIAKICSLAKAFNCSYSDAWNTDATWVFIISNFDLYVNGYSVPELIEVCKKTLKQMSFWDGTLDQDDLVWFPVVRGYLLPYLDFIVVDEAQDMNEIQLQFIARLIKKDKLTKKWIGKIAFILDKNQAIYSFRGSMPNGAERIEKKYACKVMPLDETFRCGKKIVDEAKRIVPGLKAFETNIDGLVEQGSKQLCVDSAKPTDYIVSRLRAPLFHLALKFLEKGLPARIKGQEFAEELIELAKTSGKKNRDEFMEYLASWVSEQETYIQQRYSSNEQMMNAKLSRCHDIRDVFCFLFEKEETVQGVVNLITLLCLNKEDKEFIELFTTHGVKGLESKKVFVLRDTFFVQDLGSQVVGTKEELNLYYVAITRAKEHLVYIDMGVN